MLPLLLAGAIAFHGTVVADDTPLPGVTVHLVSSGETRETRTDPTGTFACRDVPAGRAKLTVVNHADVGKLPKRFGVHHVATPRRFQAHFVCAGAGVDANLVGHLGPAGERREHGLPLPGARVELLSKDGKVLATQISSRGGEVELHLPLQPVPSDIRISRRGYATQTVTPPCGHPFKGGLFPKCAGED